MTDDRLEKVRAEIERRINELQPCNTSDNLRAHGAIAAYYQILSFINSMQEEHEFQEAGGDSMRKVINAINTNLSKEPVIEDLEEAAKHYLYSNILYDDVYVGEPTDKDCIEMFKAGADWQKERTTKKACGYLKDNIYRNLYCVNGEAGFPTAEFIKELRKHLEV